MLLDYEKNVYLMLLKRTQFPGSMGFREYLSISQNDIRMYLPRYVLYFVPGLSWKFIWD